MIPENSCITQSPWKFYKKASSHPKLWLIIKHTLPKEMPILEKERSDIHTMGTSGYFTSKYPCFAFWFYYSPLVWRDGWSMKKWGRENWRKAKDKNHHCAGISMSPKSKPKFSAIKLLPEVTFISWSYICLIPVLNWDHQLDGSRLALTEGWNGLRGEQMTNLK